MTLFFFDVREDQQWAPDQQGLELARPEDARHHALEIAITYMRHLSDDAGEHACTIDVVDQNRKRLYGVHIAVG